MKIFISADIEGISGVVSRAHTSSAGYDYQRARMLMTEEVNAAIKGACEAGAEEVLVNDSHGSMTNIIIEALDPRARLISGTPKKHGMMEGIDSSYDAAIMIGYHGRMNSSGVLSHTNHGGVVSNISINGKNSGEFYVNASVAGFFGVPVVLVSGDNILSQEVADANSKIETVVVKTSHGRNAAECISPQIVRNMITERVKEVLGKIDSIPLTKVEGPVEVKMAFLNSGFAEEASLMPHTQLVEPNVVLYNADSIVEGYQAIMAMIKIASTIM